MAWARVASSWMATIQGEKLTLTVNGVSVAEALLERPLTTPGGLS